MKLNQLLGLSLLSLAQTSCSQSTGAMTNNGNSVMQVSPNNTILQNLYALSMNQTFFSSPNSSLSYISLLLGLNTSCTANVTQMLNSSAGNFTFFAPSDQAFRAIPGFPDFGADFCQSCGSSGNGFTGGSGGIIGRMQQQQSQQQCPRGCNDTSLTLNATSSQLMPCLPQILQYHLLNETLTFNSTSFGFLNRSSYNLTVLPSMLNSSCLVNLVNVTMGSTNETSGSVGTVSTQQQQGVSGQNNQVLVFNITNSGGNNSTSGSSNMSSSSSNSGNSQFNVTILHGINIPANVTVFDIQSSNGVLHVIDAMLIPPANMTDTIISTYNSGNSTSESSGSSNSTSMMLPSFLNQADLEQYANMSGITVFLPDMNSISNSGNSTSGGGNSSNSTSSGFNITNYIFPSLLYNNRSFEIIGNLSDGVFFQQNLTNLNGDNVTVLFGRNNAMLFNGSRVTQSNILMKNGVLHLFNNSSNLISGGGASNSTGNSSGNSTVAAGLGRILRQFV